MATVEARIAALMRQMSQEQNNLPGVMVLLADGTWAACRGGEVQNFPSEALARAYLRNCDPIIVDDI